MSEETVVVSNDPHLGVEPNVVRVSPGPVPLVVKFHNGLQVYVVGDKCSVVSFDTVDRVMAATTSSDRSVRGVMVAGFAAAFVLGVAAFSMGYFYAKNAN